MVVAGKSAAYSRDSTLHAAVEFRSQRPGIGGDRNAQVGIEPQHVGRKQCRRADALAVLGRHGDDQPPDAPRGKGLQHPVIGPVEGFELEKGIDPEGEIGEGRGRGRLRVVRKHQPLGKRRAAGKQRKARKYGIARGSIRRGVPAGYENLCGGALRRGRFGWFEHFTEFF